MAKHRAKKEGMVRHRSDGRWEGRIVVGHNDDGTPIFKWLYAKTQRDLLDKLKINQELFRKGNLCSDCRITLEEWLNRWLTEYMPDAVRESTLVGYENIMRNYVIPYIGYKRLMSLTGRDVHALYTHLLEEGRVHFHPDYGHALSTSMVNKIHGALHRALGFAVRERLIPHNPADDVVAPRPRKTEKQILDEQQLDKFVEALEEVPEWKDFFYTSLTTGARVGELCGLVWPDFCGTTGKLRIQRTLRRAKGGGYSLGDTKTYAGTRTLYLPESTTKRLVERQKNSYSKWVFWDPLHPEKPIIPDQAYRRLKKILQTAGLPDMRMHDLRHTFATHALTSDIDPKTLSTMLGHTNASFTLDRYTHVTNEMQRRAASVVEQFILSILEDDFYGEKT